MAEPIDFAVVCGIYMMLEEDDQLGIEERRRRDRRIPRIAIKFYADSPFLYLYNSKNDQALLNCTGLDHKTFQEVLDLFKPYYDNYIFTEDGIIEAIKRTKGGVKKGLRRSIDAVGCLGLVLYWYRTRGSVARGLGMPFGLTSTPLYKYLKYGRRLLVVALQNHPDAKVRLPTGVEIKKYTEAVAKKYPALNDVWGACDGLKIPIQQSANYIVQNMFYNGWKASHYVNSVFCFAPNGRIHLTTINAPGTWHDSNMADYGVYSKMEQVYDLYKVKVVVDSAFTLASKPYMIKSSQIDPVGNSEVVLINRNATSVRQLSEWGMRTIGQSTKIKGKKKKVSTKMRGRGKQGVVMKVGHL